MTIQKKYSRLRKQVIAQKCIDLLYTNNSVLFFHSSGKSTCNWQQIKEELWRGGVGKSLLVRNKLYPHSVFVSPLKDSSCCPVRKNSQDAAGAAEVNSLSSLEHSSLDAAESSSTKSRTFPSGGGELTVNEMLSSRLHFLFQGPTLLVPCSSLEQMALVLEKCAPPSFVSVGAIYEKAVITHLDLKRLMELHRGGGVVYLRFLQSLKQWHHSFSLLKNLCALRFLNSHSNNLISLLGTHSRATLRPQSYTLEKSTDKQHCHRQED